MAEAAKKQKPEEGAESAPEAGQPKDRKGLILMILVGINSLAFLGVGYGLYQYSQATKAAIQSQAEVEDPKADAKHEEKKEAVSHEAKLVALETFYVNLNGTEGYKLMKVTMSLEVDAVQAQDELLKRQAQVRDLIIVLLSSKTYGEVAGENGQEKIKNEIMETVNSILTKGKIKKILFTEFIFH